MELILLICILIVPAIAQFMVTSNYNKYKKIENSGNLTGYDTARKILDENGLKDILVIETQGTLTDHYDPSRKVVRLSSDIYHGNTIAACSIAAHECGHAIQDKEGYLYMRIRALIFPVVRIATSLSYIIIFLGLLMEALNMIYLGIALVGSGLVFQLVTLPVEINASKRAKEKLLQYQMINEEEGSDVTKMLGAAAMTYVAGVLASAAQLLRLVLIFGRRDD